MWPASRNLEETCDLFFSVPPANLYEILQAFSDSSQSKDLNYRLNIRGFYVSTIAFLRGRGTQDRAGEGDCAGAGAGVRPGLFPTKLQYSSSWLPTQFGDNTPHFPWLPPPLLVRRYDVVFSELKCGEVTWNNTDRTRPHRHVKTGDSWIIISICVALKIVVKKTVLKPQLTWIASIE